MNKAFYFPIALSAMAFLAACGDDSSSSPAAAQVPTSDSSSPVAEISSASTEGITPAENVGLSSASDVPVTDFSSDSQAVNPASGETAVSSGSQTTGEAPTASSDPVVLTAEAVSSGSAYTCEVSALPAYLASGYDVTCDGSYIGQLLNDTDSSAYDPSLEYTDFVSIAKVFASVQPGEKVVFLLRHGDRYSTADGGLLTGLGEFQAIEVGKKLTSSATPNYFHSEVERTLQTANKIAQGRGQTEFNHTVLKELNGDWFIKDNDKLTAYGEASTGTYEVIADWAYNGVSADAFYDLAASSEAFINDVVVGKMAAQGDFSIAISHDQFIVPLVVYLTGRQIDLKKYENGRWLHFLAGAAFIIKADGTVKFVPVKGLDTGVQT